MDYRNINLFGRIFWGMIWILILLIMCAVIAFGILGFCLFASWYLGLK